MYSDNLSLDKLPLNQTGIVLELNCNSTMKTRFLDLGLIPGTYITPIFSSPFREPTAYEFRNTVISIRSDDSKLIKIEKDVP